MKISKGDVGHPSPEGAMPVDAEITAALGEEGVVRTASVSRGTRVDRYEILDWIGAGGMGVVYTAHDPMLDRKVAVKLFHRPADARNEKKESQMRFLREAQAMARLSHPNVLAVYDVGILHGRIFIATEYVAGQTLSEWLLAANRTWQEILGAFADAGRGLAAAHVAGLIHRDFKPSNVLVGNDGRIRVMDFGLARRLNERDELSGSSTVEESDGETGRNALESDLTDVGAAVGTPAYMAPEQHEAREVDGRADQFSFCVALYQALFGCHPFGGNDRRAILRSIRVGPSVPPRDTNVPVRVRSAVLRGLAYDPAQRWPDMNSLLAALARNPRRRWLSAVALGGVALMTAGGVAVGRHAESTAHICAGAANKVDAVWGEHQKTAVRQALLASKQAYAPMMWQRVENLLDDYTGRWAAARYDVCAATRLRQEQSEQVMDVRMACLDKRLFDLSATIDTLRAGDAKTVQNALHIVGSMTPLRDCQELVTAPHLTPPAEASAEIDVLRQRVAEVKALSFAGHYGRAIDIGTKAFVRAKAVGWAPVTAEAAYWLGITEQRAGNTADAEKHLLTAAWEAEAGHDDELLVRARATLVGVYGMGNQRFAEAELWAQQARAALRRVADDPDLEALLLNSLGLVHTNRGQFRSALHQFDRAIALLDGVQAERPPASDGATFEDDIQRQVGEVVRLSGLVHNNMAVVYERMGNYEKAREHFQIGADILEGAFGVHHPLWAVAASNLGGILRRLGHDAAARDYLERARHSFGQSVGRTHPHYAATLVRLAELEVDLGSYLTAEAMAQRAIETFENMPDAPQHLLLGALECYARTLAARKDARRARAAFERALETGESLSGKTHPMRGQLLMGLAELELSEGKLDVARKHAVLAIDVLEAELGGEHPDVAAAAMVLGMILHRLGNLAEAKIHLERALSIRLLAPGRPESLAQIQAALARILMEEGQSERARELAQAAIAGYAKAGQRGLEPTQALQAWLESHPER